MSESNSAPLDENVVTNLLDDLNLHCTDHAPEADCEGCRLQIETHVSAALRAAREAQQQAVSELTDVHRILMVTTWQR